MQCSMYLFCLGDMMKQFPPTSKGILFTLDFEKSPFISLATTISLQLGDSTKFLLEISDINEENVTQCGTVFLVRRNWHYDVWMQTVVVAQGLTESQALFVYATLFDVVGLPSTKKVTVQEKIIAERAVLIPFFSITERKLCRN